MQYTQLGRTGIGVSRVAFGAGPVSGLLTGSDEAAQMATVNRAVQSGINWFDTAAGYGQGQSEIGLGRALAALDPTPVTPIHVATKVRIVFDTEETILSQVTRGIEESLKRLQLPSVTLLQLHNGITNQRGDEPFSVSPDDILSTNGILEALNQVRERGLTRHIGLTGTGHPEALRRVIQSGAFETIQLPYNVLNPSAGLLMPADFDDRNYGNILEDCQEAKMGVFAIRVFAGGALLGQAPSAHTLTTPFFPLALYERDAAQAREISQRLGIRDLTGYSLRFSLSHPAVHSAIIGFGTPEHVTSACHSVPSS
jgi:aryl-alcohol dehydrogenase-like predicted oxidoreductase